MVSIMPGIEARAPERTETKSGFAGSPNLAPTSFSIRATAPRMSASSSFGSFLPFS